MRAILGQQVGVSAARGLAGQLVAAYGKPIENKSVRHSGLRHVFPSAQRLARAGSLRLGMPLARQSSLKALAEAVAEDPDLFRPFGTVEEAIARLRTIRGVGEWTAQYIALRALREMDAFPASDVGLLRGAAVMEGSRPSAASLLQRAEVWRPWPRLCGTTSLGGTGEVRCEEWRRTWVSGCS